MHQYNSFVNLLDAKKLGAATHTAALDDTAQVSAFDKLCFSSIKAFAHEKFWSGGNIFQCYFRANNLNKNEKGKLWKWYSFKMESVRIHPYQKNA